MAFKIIPINKELTRWFGPELRDPTTTINQRISNRGIMQQHHYMILSNSISNDYNKMLTKRDYGDIKSVQRLLNQMK